MKKQKDYLKGISMNIYQTIIWKCMENLWEGDVNRLLFIFYSGGDEDETIYKKDKNPSMVWLEDSKS